MCMLLMPRETTCMKCQTQIQKKYSKVSSAEIVTNLLSKQYMNDVCINLVKFKGVQDHIYRVIPLC